FAEDPVNPNLLFAGTEFGAFFTVDGGKKWIQLKGSFPTVAVRDMVIHPRAGDLIVATFGRSFYILDDVSPLRQIKAEALQQPALMFPAKDAPLYIQRRPLGGTKKAFQGDAFFTADNPPFGAVFTYYLKEKLKTKKEARQEAEKEAAKKGAALPYPSNDELRAEAEEPKPEMYFMIYDESGAPIRRVSGALSEGFHRTAWDLRYAAPSLPPEKPADQPEEDFPDAGTIGPLVMPGKYSVRLFQKKDGVVTELGAPQSFNVAAEVVSGIDAADRAARDEFHKKVARLYRTVSGAVNMAKDLETRLTAIHKALHETPSADKQLGPVADSIAQRNREILRALRGDVALAARNENVPTSINDRVTSIMEGERFAITKPTKTHLDAYAIASDEFAQQLAKLRTLVEVDLAKLEKDIEAAGAPWTPGRVPSWQER
ncbi:MAG: glycosyl hydrolase, partial [Acidobacteria bacterium]